MSHSSLPIYPSNRHIAHIFFISLVTILNFLVFFKSSFCVSHIWLHTSSSSVFWDTLCHPLLSDCFLRQSTERCLTNRANSSSNFIHASVSQNLYQSWALKKCFKVKFSTLSLPQMASVLPPSEQWIYYFALLIILVHRGSSPSLISPQCFGGGPELWGKTCFLWDALSVHIQTSSGIKPRSLVLESSCIFLSCSSLKALANHTMVANMKFTFLWETLGGNRVKRLTGVCC